jgi:hypothetical protein
MWPCRWWRRRRAVRGRGNVAITPELACILEHCLRGDDAAALAEAVRACRDVNERLPDGESVLFHAALSGKIEFVRILLDAGADPNYRAEEPAADMLATTPLDLIQQARFLMDWDLYQPIAALLQSRGARDSDGGCDTPEDLLRKEAGARAWQQERRIVP